MVKMAESGLLGFYTNDDDDDDDESCWYAMSASRVGYMCVMLRRWWNIANRSCEYDVLHNRCSMKVWRSSIYFC